MAILTEALIIEALKWLLGIIGEKISLSKKAKEKLVKVHLEILKNRDILKNTGCLKMTHIAVDDKTFISTVKKLSNEEITPLFTFTKRGFIPPARKKEVQRRKTQYAINYVVTQIDSLKTLIDVRRNSAAPAVRLCVRLRTLDKHLATLEKVLRPVKK
jgi:hypothetical protein